MLKGLFLFPAIAIALSSAAAYASDAENSWRVEADYPAKALREGREGTTVVWILVGKDGLPKDCGIVSSSGWDDLDEAACERIERRARYRPATDGRGNAIESHTLFTTRWQIGSRRGGNAEAEGLRRNPAEPLAALEPISPESAPAVPDNDEPRDFPADAQPIGNVATWIRTADYPPEALKDWVQGISELELVIGRQGNILDCDITGSSGSVELDQAACAKYTERGRFLPALDERGEPIESVWSSKVSWVLDVQPAFEEYEWISAMTIDEEGRMAHCEILSHAGIDEGVIEQEDPCGTAFRYEPFTGDDGEPVARRVIYTEQVRFEELPSGRGP